eukprot:4846242-Pyramimonas_sp.AAC.1
MGLRRGNVETAPARMSWHGHPAANVQNVHADVYDWLPGVQIPQQDAIPTVEDWMFCERPLRNMMECRCIWR